MSAEELRSIANETTPQSITVPSGYAGLLIWALGKWGAGAVFLFLLMPVYQDLKASNQRIADISIANVEVIKALATEVNKSSERIMHLDDAVRKLENNSQQK